MQLYTLEESPELLLQFDGANDSDVEQPGKVDVVKGDEPDEVEKDGGGWVVVGTQRKTRKDPSVLAEVESRMGRLKRMFPALLSSFNPEELAHHVERYGEDSMLRYQERRKKQDEQRQDC